MTESSPAELKRDFGTASILRDGRVVFNLAGNKYRLVVRINCAYRVVYADQADRRPARGMKIGP